MGEHRLLNILTNNLSFFNISISNFNRMSTASRVSIWLLCSFVIEIKILEIISMRLGYNLDVRYSYVRSFKDTTL